MMCFEGLEYCSAKRKAVGQYASGKSALNDLLVKAALAHRRLPYATDAVVNDHAVLLWNGFEKQ